MTSSFQKCIIFYLIQACACSCYFTIELQGEYLMQSVKSGTHVQYSHVNITSDSIPMWGFCYRNIGNNVLLTDSLIGGSCIRCFSLRLRSKNILQVLTEGLDKCYTTEAAAEATCPDENARNSHKEIILYKTKGVDSKTISTSVCPLNGKYKFVYSNNDESENKMECVKPTSLLDDCPSDSDTGSALNLKFQGCNFEDLDVRYKCLGDWEGPNNQRYLTLMDTRLNGEKGPQYRCAIYKENKENGNIFMALSSDSTCTTDLHSAVLGFETYNLTSLGFGEWPQDVYDNSCRFPLWSLGEWEQLYISNSSITYRDHSTFHTLSMRCVNTFDNEQFIVYSKSTCDAGQFSSLWLKQRSNNVLEFQLGKASSKTVKNSLFLNTSFDNNAWITQGRKEIIYESPCPIMGEYTGFIPNETQLSAKLSSDQKSPEIMYYTVSDYEVTREVYEEREYRCLGQWDEGGVTYTYTQRKDIGTYECFVGKIISNNEIYIKEAGEHCGRDIDPLILGMKLIRTGSQQTSTDMFPQYPTASSYSSERPQPSTKSWKPVTAPPKQNTGSRNTNLMLLTTALILRDHILKNLLNVRGFQ